MVWMGTSALGESGLRPEQRTDRRQSQGKMDDVDTGVRSAVPVERGSRHIVVLKIPGLVFSSWWPRRVPSGSGAEEFC